MAQPKKQQSFKSFLLTQPQKSKKSILTKLNKTHNEKQVLQLWKKNIKENEVAKYIFSNRVSYCDINDVLTPFL